MHEETTGHNLQKNNNSQLDFETSKSKPKHSSAKNRLALARKYSESVNTLCENSNITPPTSADTARKLSEGLVVKIISDVLCTKG